MKNKGIGQYDLEYKDCPCFWGKNPAKYVRKFVDLNILTKGKVLDLGAGEGKNSFYLQKKGFNVTSVEVSKFAIRNFLDRIIDEKLITYPDLILSNIVEFQFNLFSWDLIINYGVLHCLKDTNEANRILDKMISSTTKGGYNILSSFTNNISITNVQDYLSPLLLDNDYVKNYYEKNGWEIILFETDVITETHPTSNIEHQHSLYRLIVKKI